MTEEEEVALAESGALFGEPDSKILLSAGIGRHWPDARGIFSSPERDFVAWVNEEDHLRFTITRPGADVGGVLAQFHTMHAAMTGALQKAGTDFMYSPGLGFLTACPHHLGVGLRLSVSMFLPLLSARRDFKDICKRLQLVVKGAGNQDGMFDILSPEIFGATSKELADLVHKGCRQLAEMEALLIQGHPISLPGVTRDGIE